MTFEDLKKSGLIAKRAAALGLNIRDTSNPVLEEAYKRLWLALEIVSKSQPTGFSGWILKKLGVLTRQDGYDLLDKSVEPAHLEYLWKECGPISGKPRFFYWRTALIDQYIWARNFCYIPIKELKWLEEQDPLLFTFLKNFGRDIQSNPGSEDLLALGNHYDLESLQGEAVSLGDVLLEFNYPSLMEYLNFPETGDLKVQAASFKDRVNA